MIVERSPMPEKSPHPVWPMAAVDLHQHLWPEPLVERLRSRSRVPYLRGWTLHTQGEPPCEIDPTHHDVRQRLEHNAQDGIGLACLSLSSPLGIESLRGPSATGLLDAWHESASVLPVGFAAWASVSSVDPDLDGLADLVGRGFFVGVQVPATDVRTPAGWERLGPVLDVAERAGKPLLVHPGPEPRDPGAATRPGWWPAVVGYVGQLQAAWWGWHAAQVRASHPTLRVVFAAGAGLAPVHHERYTARGGGATGEVDPLIHVDTSSYGPQGLDALARVLGIDALVLGSDRPYAQPWTGPVAPERMGAAASRAIRVTNPRRVLGLPGDRREGVRTWPRAS
jgi:predicted TIM-barrel fold metal-dependent hydrolase